MFLHVHELTAGYGHGTVLHGVNLDLDRGEVLGLLGRNGVGKSTLTMTLMGIVGARSGSVQLDGRELAGKRIDTIARAGIALIPQGRRIWPGLTVAEHINLAHTKKPKSRHREWTSEKIYDLLPRLAQRRGQPAGLLSGGEQQMLAIARALLTNPELVLMDEPSDGLAPAIVHQVGEVIGAMRASGVGAVLVEQDLHLAFDVADRIAVMHKGEIAHTAETPTFRRQPDIAADLLGVG